MKPETGDVVEVLECEEWPIVIGMLGRIKEVIADLEFETENPAYAGDWIVNIEINLPDDDYEIRKYECVCQFPDHVKIIARGVPAV